MTGPAGAPLRVVVVDDEALARVAVRSGLECHPDVEVVAECANGFEAVAAVADLRPDVMFLDIQMPALSGFDVLELVEADVAVVFVTAYDEFAVRAFEVHAVDYLLKPFEPARLDLALERARARVGSRPAVRAAELASAAAARPAPLTRVLAREGGKVHVFPVAEVEYVAARDDYVAFHVRGREVLKQQTLAEVEAGLDPARFVRIHRSFIVNLDRLATTELYARDSRVAVLSSGAKLPVSRAGWARLRELL